ncbi:MAG: SAM-dependent chlorinase/fluorinase [Planctomycetota bacterium]
MQLPRPSGIVTLLSDFGLADPWVGIMKGVVKRHNPAADVLDYCHGVPAHDVRVGAFFLAAVVDRFPPGTVHVAVVDPGVGTARRALVACAAGCFWVAPDNGLLESILRRDDVEVRAVDIDKLDLRPASRTFHGRDVFAPLGGMLSSGRFGFRALGDRVADPCRLDGDPFAPEASPCVIAVDRFGNLITNVGLARVQSEGWAAVRVRDHVVPLVATYAEAAPGEALALINSYDLLEVAINRGSAAERLRVSVGATFEPIVQR